MRIKINLSGKTYHVRDLIAGFGYEWDGTTWWKIVWHKNIESEIQGLKDRDIIFYWDGITGYDPLGATINLSFLNPKNQTGKNMIRLRKKLRELTKGVTLNKEQHLELTNFYNRDD